MTTMYPRLKKVALFLALLTSLQANISMGNPLEYYVRTVYPVDAKTVLDAAKYLLEPIEYQIVLDDHAPKDAMQLAMKPIEPIASLPRTMSIADALQILIGEENYLIVDHHNKLISFTSEP